MRFTMFLAATLYAAVAQAEAPPAVPATSTGATTAPAPLTVDTQNSSITYHLVHKMHKVDGTSHKIEGRARLSATGQAQVAVRAPVESFDSENVNRDAHMKEVLEAARYPAVELKAVGDVGAAPTKFPSTVERTFKAELSFHGIKKTIDLPVKITFERADQVHAAAHLVVSLDEFKIERPSLFFIKVDDALQIDAQLQFKN